MLLLAEHEYPNLDTAKRKARERGYFMRRRRRVSEQPPNCGVPAHRILKTFPSNQTHVPTPATIWPPGSVTPASAKNNIEQMAMKNAQQNQQMQALKAQQAGQGAQGGQGGAQQPAQMPPQMPRAA